MSYRLSDLDRLALRELRKRGDDHGLARHVIHWLFFQSDEQRQAARNEAITAGWGEYGDNIEPSEDDVWCLSLDATHDLTEAVLIQRLAEMNAIAARHGGVYDGWEAQIAAPEEGIQRPGLMARLLGKR